MNTTVSIKENEASSKKEWFKEGALAKGKETGVIYLVVKKAGTNTLALVNLSGYNNQEKFYSYEIGITEDLYEPFYGEISIKSEL